MYVFVCLRPTYPLNHLFADLPIYRLTCASSTFQLIGQRYVIYCLCFVCSFFSFIIIHSVSPLPTLLRVVCEWGGRGLYAWTVCLFVFYSLLLASSKCTPYFHKYRYYHAELSRDACILVWAAECRWMNVERRGRRRVLRLVVLSASQLFKSASIQCSREH